MLDFLDLDLVDFLADADADSHTPVFLFLRVPLAQRLRLVAAATVAVEPGLGSQFPVFLFRRIPRGHRGGMVVVYIFIGYFTSSPSPPIPSLGKSLAFV
jgi:hypothetical protein